MRNLFDYVFYKFSKAYYKWDKNSGLTAIAAVSQMQFFLISILLLIPVRLIFSVSTLSACATVFKWIGGSGVLLVFFLNYRKYNSQYVKIKEKYENESYSFFKGVLVFIAVFAPLIIFLILAVKFKPFQ